jgi:transcriptional regulator with XRE-family HTH domain
MIEAAIREALEGRGLSQRQAAAELGVSQQALSQWVTGAAIPNRAQTKRLAEWLQITEDRVRFLRAETIRRQAIETANPEAIAYYMSRFEELDAKVGELERRLDAVQHTQKEVLSSLLGGLLDKLQIVQRAEGDTSLLRDGSEHRDP